MHFLRPHEIYIDIAITQIILGRIPVKYGMYYVHLRVLCCGSAGRLCCQRQSQSNWWDTQSRDTGYRDRSVAYNNVTVGRTSILACSDIHVPSSTATSPSQLFNSFMQNSWNIEGIQTIQNAHMHQKIRMVRVATSAAWHGVVTVISFKQYCTHTYCKSGISCWPLWPSTGH